MWVVRIRCLFMVRIRAGMGESGFLFVALSVCMYDCRLWFKVEVDSLGLTVIHLLVGLTSFFLRQWRVHWSTIHTSVRHSFVI